MINPDFAKVADAMGITGENIHKVEDVEAAVKGLSIITALIC
jgi:pyruvate dehydrogenase (quinone)